VQATTRRRWRKIKSDPRRYAQHLATGRKWGKEHPEAIRRKSARYRKKNLNKVRAYARRWMKRWYHANPRQARRLLKAYRLSNPKKWHAYDRKVYRDKLRTDPKWRAHKKKRNRLWAKRNPEKQRRRVGRYRARKMAASGYHSFDEWMLVVRAHSWRCFYCGERLNRKTVTKDHRIPLSKGGTDFARNLVPACKACNSGKADRLSYKRQRER
jgi:5-methylcytosine-specific restriction endonuclease McrA